MGLCWNLEVGLVEFFDLLVTSFLAIWVVRIGWRFTNVRAAKDLVLEEGRRILQVCDRIRKPLRGISHSEIPKYQDFTEHLDDLGNYLENLKKMYTNMSKRSGNIKANDLDVAYQKLREDLSEDSSREDVTALDAINQLRKFEDKIVDLLVDVNH
ncbi:MAG: hypothetical protein OXI05_06060 [Bacteroidota bacterium]|nr:hypothetical protein [Bacteroidota bacterium]